MQSKHYYLFGWRIFTIMVDLEEEVEEETDTSLGANIQLSDGNPPAFGFTPWSPYYDEEGEE